jgi:hypothetical protein
VHYCPRFTRPTDTTGGVLLRRGVQGVVLRREGAPDRLALLAGEAEEVDAVFGIGGGIGGLRLSVGLVE